MQEKSLKNHELFRKALKERNLRLEDAATMLGISDSMVYNLSTNKRNPSGKVAIRLRDQFGLPVEDWFC